MSFCEITRRTSHKAGRLPSRGVVTWGASRRVLQFRPHPSEPPRDARDGGWRCRSRLEFGRDHCAARVIFMQPFHGKDGSKNRNLRICLMTLLVLGILAIALVPCIMFLVSFYGAMGSFGPSGSAEVPRCVPLAGFIVLGAAPLFIHLLIRRKK